MGQPGSGALVREGDWLSARPRAVLLGVIAIFALVGVIVAASGGGSGTSSSGASSAASSSAPAATSSIAPVGLRGSRLKAFVSQTLRQPVYWAGPSSGDAYEVQRTTNGSVYVRYLPPGARVADSRPLLLVATYSYPNALTRLEAAANGAGIHLRDGGLALVDPARPTNIHIAFPGVAYEIEVFDPSPAVARRIAESGDIRPVG